MPPVRRFEDFVGEISIFEDTATFGPTSSAKKRQDSFRRAREDLYPTGVVRQRDTRSKPPSIYEQEEPGGDVVLISGPGIPTRIPTQKEKA